MAVVTVIGGAGRMGSWFAKFLKRNGYQVVISDKDRGRAKKLAQRNGVRFVEDYDQATIAADIILLATPTTVTRKILEQRAQNLARGRLLIEISSVKEPVRAIIQKLRRKGVAVLSIHPMFGPGIKSLRKQPILVVSSTNKNPLAKNFLSLFKRKGARIVPIDFDIHDRYAATTLALPHFTNIVFTSVLRSLKINPNRLRELAGTTFRLQFLNAEALHHEQPDNEASISRTTRNPLEC